MLDGTTKPFSDFLLAYHLWNSVSFVVAATYLSSVLFITTYENKLAGNFSKIFRKITTRMAQTQTPKSLIKISTVPPSYKKEYDIYNEGLFQN
jgi:hypothetical protein